MSSKLTKLSTLAETREKAQVVKQFASIRITDIHEQITHLDKPILRWVYSKKILDLKKERQVWSYVIVVAATMEQYANDRLK